MNQFLLSKKRGFMRRSLLLSDKKAVCDLEYHKLLKKTYQLYDDPVIVFDLNNYEIVTANDAFLQVFQYASDDFLDLKINDLDIFQDAAKLKTIITVLKEYGFLKQHVLQINSKRTVLFNAIVESGNDELYALCMLKDITEKKDVENVNFLYEQQFGKDFFSKRISDSEGKYNELIENAIAASTTTTDGEIVYANKTYANMFGFETADEIISKNVNGNTDSSFRWKNPLKRQLLLRKLNKKGLVDKFTCTFINNKGEDVYILLTAKLSNNLIYSISVDITKEVEVKKIVKDNQERFKALYDNAVAALIRTDAKNEKVIEANKAAAFLFGYESINEFKEKFTVDHFIKPPLYSFLEQLKKYGRLEKREIHCKAKDGQEFWIEASLKLNKENAFIDWVCIDITSKKQMVLELDLANEKTEKNEVLYRGLFDNLSAGVVVHANDTSIAMANNRASELLGVTLDQLQGKTAMDKDWFFTDFNNIKLPIDKYPVNIIKQTKAPIKDFIAGVNRPKTKDKVWLMVNGFPVIDKSGEITEIVISFVDFTDRKVAEDNLIEAKEKAEQSDRLKSAFLTNMSHEIRTPMNGILGFTNLLKDTNISGAEQQEYIKIIEESGDRMLKTIQDIIDISKIESGVVKLNYSKVNLNEKLNYLHDFFKIEANSKGLDIFYENELLNNNLVINSDKHKITSILTKLIKNAIKYTNKGSITFGCKLANVAGEKMIEFIVKDTGIGIAEDKKKIIFDRFIQADMSDNRVYEGSGLGLSIAKAYADMLYGKILVESKIGKGSEFRFVLPYECVDEKIDIINRSNNNFSDIKKLKILVVDDENFVRTFLGILLKDISKEMLYATDGLEAIEIAKEHSDIDLILMDIRMPGIDGFEATKSIREFNKDSLIIIQSAFVENGVYEKAKEVGADNYVTKPIIKQKLFSILREKFSE